MSLEPLLNTEHQTIIISMLELIPETLTPYIHYAGEESILTPYNIIVPVIPRDNNLGCRLVNHIGREHYVDISITALGPGGKIGIPYLLQDQDGNKLIMKLSKITDYKSEFSLTPASNTSNNSKLCLSKTNLYDMSFIKSDEFTNETLVGYILNGKIKDTDPQFFVKHYQGYICQNIGDINKGSLLNRKIFSEGDKLGVNIMEYCDLGMVSTIAQHRYFKQFMAKYHVNHLGTASVKELFNVDLIKCILTQIVVGLDVMQTRCGFTSGDLKAGNVFIKSDPVDVEYRGIRIEAPFSCKIADYGKSSAQITQRDGHAVRFYTDNKWANIYLTLHPFENEFYLSEGELYYRPDLLPTQMYTRTRHMGIPYYQSFDYYTFLVSFLTIPEVYYTFFSNVELMQIFWYTAFDESTANSVRKEIYRHVVDGTGAKYADALSIIRTSALKCDAIELVIQALST